MNSIQDILNAFRERFDFIRADVYKDGHEQDITDTVENWLLNALTEFERETKKEMIELGIKTARTYSLSSMIGEERKVVVPEALYRELLSELEREKQTGNKHFVCECTGHKHWCTSVCPNNKHDTLELEKEKHT